MILIRNLNQIKRQLPPIALTIGNFDGVHLAHQKIIATTQEIAQKNQLKTAILTFEPHPILFLNKNNSNFNQNFRIYNLANKIRILKQFNSDYFLVIPFNNYLSSLNHNSFVEEILINKFNTKSLIIGYDFTF
ncbi:MAG: bifunctional riboflavin kinase/FMN adenylyltransferase, partial [Alphaproteobacteria bacterium]